MTKIANRIERHSPRGTWSFEWQGDGDSRYRTTVYATYRSDRELKFADVPSGHPPLTHPIANTIWFTHEVLAGPGTSEGVRLTRAATEALQEAMGHALVWDGN